MTFDKGKHSPKVSLSYCVYNNKKEVKCEGDKGGLDALFPAKAQKAAGLMRKSEGNKMK